MKYCTCCSSALRKAAEGQEGEKTGGICPLEGVRTTMGSRKVLQNQIPAGWRVFVQETGFISGKQSQEVRFGIVHPIPAFHRKLCIKSKSKRPKTFHLVASRVAGSTSSRPRALFLHLRPPWKSRGLKKKLAPWRSSLTHRTGGACPWPPLSLRAHTHLTSPSWEGKMVICTFSSQL